jgi:signal transduction histidine kinase
MLISDKDSDASSNLQVITSSSLQYPAIVTELRIEQSQITPISTEATTLATRLAKAPVAILMVTGKSGCQISSISGLAKLVHLPTNPDLLLELAGLEYCYAQVMSSESKFSVTDCQLHPELCRLPLVKVHGIQAYLGLPIVTAAKDRLGTIAILDFKPRQFNNRELEILQLICRLVASEFERKLLSQDRLDRSIDRLHYGTIQGFDDRIAAAEYREDRRLIDIIDVQADLTALKHNLAANEQQQSIQGELLADLAQELRTPLTSILGMASVLQQEIYGPLCSKQKDYLGIIHRSGQKLVEIVDEISTLSESNPSGDKLSPPPERPLQIESVTLDRGE